MSIDILAKPGEDVFEACPKLKEIKCFTDYAREPESLLPVNELITYVVLLYSKDSILNKKPIDELPMRRLKAAKMAGLEAEKTSVVKDVFELESDKVADLIVRYILSQNHYEWADRCACEFQLEENLRIRMTPISKSDDDKKTIEASTKKDMLTTHFSKYRKQMKELDAEIFGDNENVVAHVKKSRATLESLV